MDKRIEQLLTFFKITNAAFDFMNSFQLAINKPVEPNKMHQLHKLALMEIEKESPDLLFMEVLLAEMESLAEINNTLTPKFPSGGFPVGE